MVFYNINTSILLTYVNVKEQAIELIKTWHPSIP